MGILAESCIEHGGMAVKEAWSGYEFPEASYITMDYTFYGLIRQLKYSITNYQQRILVTGRMVTYDKSSAM